MIYFSFVCKENVVLVASGHASVGASAQGFRKWTQSCSKNEYYNFFIKYGILKKKDGATIPECCGEPSR